MVFGGRSVGTDEGGERTATGYVRLAEGDMAEVAEEEAVSREGGRGGRPGDTSLGDREGKDEVGMDKLKCELRAAAAASLLFASCVLALSVMSV